MNHTKAKPAGDPIPARPPLNLYEQQRRNRWATVWVMAGLIGLLVFLGWGFDVAIYQPSNGGVFFPIGTFIALVVGGISAGSSYFNGDRHVLKSVEAIPVDEWNHDRKQELMNVVEEMAIASGLPKPAVYVIPDEDPNAFATGRNPVHASIAVTEGLVKRLNREELQGVIAHEMSHIRNFDIRLMTVVAAMAGAIVLLADWSIRSMRFGKSGRQGRSSGKNSGGGAIIMCFVILWVLTAFIAPLLTRLLALFVSRQREYLADASAAELTRNPLGLAKALQKLESFGAPTASVKRGVAHLCIVDPLGAKVNEREGRLAELFASHPPLAKRVAALKGMGYLAHKS